MTSPQPEPAAQQAPALSQIAEALSTLQADLIPIARDTPVTVKTDKGQYSYSFADLAAITRQLYPRMGKLGLSFSAAPTLNERGQFVLRYKLLHVSGEQIPGEYPLPTDVKSPQAMGSAITYARRYCLCAVTGVVTDDDDGAAAQHAAKEQAVQPSDPERADALNRVSAAWHEHFGNLDWEDVGTEYAAWSNGKSPKDASAADWRRFAAYVAALPAREAGGTPGEQPPAQDPYSKPREITEPQRKRVMAELKARYADRQDQLTFLRSVLGREITSRSELTFDDAKELIDVFESEKTT